MWLIEKNGKRVENKELQDFLEKNGQDLPPISYIELSGEDLERKVNDSWKEGVNYLTGQKVTDASAGILRTSAYIASGKDVMDDTGLTDMALSAGFGIAAARNKLNFKTKSNGNGANSPKNVALYEKYKEVLRTMEKANPLVENLMLKGKLPDNFITKDEAIKKGWRPGKAINNYKEGGQIGGDIFKNSDKVLPDKKGRTWREADVGLTGNMARSKQPGTRLLYSNDGLVYVTTDHYKTVHYVCNYK